MHHTVQVHQAQNGKTPWVGASRAPTDPKSVEVGRPVCAELFRSSCTNRMNDRVDEGSIPLYSLCVRDVAQSGVIPAVPLVANKSGMLIGPYVHRCSGNDPSPRLLPWFSARTNSVHLVINIPDSRTTTRDGLFATFCSRNRHRRRATMLAVYCVFKPLSAHPGGIKSGISTPLILQGVDNPDQEC